MKFDAITIDTQVFYKNNAQLNSGIINQLKNQPVQVVFSDITLREIQKKRKEQAKSVITKLKDVVSNGKKSQQLPKSSIDTMNEILNQMSDPESHADSEIKQFVKDTNAIVISVDDVNLDSILNDYFGNRPPFNNKGKKSEFPDAIAFNSLKNWAEKNNKTIVVVSDDNDWKSMESLSANVVIENDLGDVLAKINSYSTKHLDEAKDIVEMLISDDVNTKKLKANFKHYVEAAINNVTYFDIEYSSGILAAPDSEYMMLNSYELLKDKNFDEVDITQISKNGFVIRVPISIKATLYVNMAFQIFDSIDKDYIPIGDTEVEKEVEFTAHALVHTDGRYENEIVDVELLGIPKAFNIGNVEFNPERELDDPDY